MPAGRSLPARNLERTLLASYVVAFAVVIAVFAFAVRFSFEALFNAQTTARLNTLARAGTAVVLFTGDQYKVDAGSFGGFSVRSEFEGLEWFDRGKHLVLRRGLTPAKDFVPHEGRERISTGGSILDTYTIDLVDPSGKSRGYVRASEANDTNMQPLRALNRGLIAGSFLALIVGAVGGALLTRVSVNRAEESYVRLRQFTDDASHELRGPLAALSSTAEVALREAPDLPPLTRARLRDLVELSSHMRRLVDDLLILARAGRSMERELFAIDLQLVFAKIRDRYGNIADAKHIDLRFAPIPEVDLYGNPDQIERVLANLIENAVRYTDEGGLVSIDFSVEVETVRLSVSDTGPGIPRESLNRIFDRFWREDPARTHDSGAGLGLSIARALARRHGGDVTVESDLGRGSTFTLVLPFRPPSFD